jgi:hypothetical protein
MDKLQILDHGIRELRRFISKGWGDIATGDLTAYERCEIREQMTQAAADLRRSLQAHETETRRLQALSQTSGRGPRSVTLRFLHTDYDLTVAAAPPLTRPTEAEPKQTAEAAS